VDEGEFDEIAPDGVEEERVPEDRVADETVGRESDGEADRLDELAVRLPIEEDELLPEIPEEGDRRMTTGDWLLVAPLVAEDEGRRIVLVDVRDEEGLERVTTGVERELLGVERVTPMEDELGVLGDRVTMLGDERELLDGGL
jgi:hypothetical protein